MQLITHKQHSILSKIAKYKFITNSQLVALGLDSSKKGVNRYVKSMREGRKALLGTVSFGVVPAKGKLEGVHYLTHYGKEILIEMGMDEEEILCPKGNATLFAQDYFHRKYVIDFQIDLDRYFTEGEIQFFDRYFDKTGNNRVEKNLRAKTKIDLGEGKYLISDAIFKKVTKEEERIYCFEMYNGKDSKRVIKQLYQYVEALHLGSPSIQYNSQKSARVLCYFEFESAKKAVMQRLKNDAFFSKMTPLFWFGSRENTTETWHDLKMNICLI